jgi:enoyl-CoA hydratase
MYNTITTAVANGILTLTINRPDKLNALSAEVLGEIDDVFKNIYKDNGIKGVIITGAGPKAFIAGADISAFSSLDKKQGEELARAGQEIFFNIENCPKPVIAAVNGFALGGGCELAMSCHFRIASTNARFGQPEVNLGLIPGYGGTQRLTQLVGKGRALQWMMTGEMIDAEKALQTGLVNEVVPAEELITRAAEILTTIFSKSPQAVAKVIAAVSNGFDKTKNGFEEEVKLFGECFGSAEMKEGVAAFLEKRKPVFN